MLIEWSEDKHKILKAERCISFDEIALELLAGRILDILQHPSRPSQRLFVVKLGERFVLVPPVKDGERLFLKTAYESRKARKRYGGSHEV